MTKIAFVALAVHALLLNFASGVPNLPLVQPQLTETPTPTRGHAVGLATPDLQKPFSDEFAEWLYNLKLWLQAYPEPPQRGLPSATRSKSAVLLSQIPSAIAMATMPLAATRPVPSAYFPTNYKPSLAQPQPTRLEPGPIACLDHAPHSCWDVVLPPDTVAEATAKPPGRPWTRRA